MHTTPSSIASRTLFKRLLYFRCFRFGFRIPFGFQTSGSRFPVTGCDAPAPHFRIPFGNGPPEPVPVILPFAGRKELQRYSAPINTVQIYKKSAIRQTAAPPNCQQSARRSFSRTPAGNNPGPDRTRHIHEPSGANPAVVSRIRNHRRRIPRYAGSISAVSRKTFSVAEPTRKRSSTLRPTIQTISPSDTTTNCRRLSGNDTLLSTRKSLTFLCPDIPNGTETVAIPPAAHPERIPQFGFVDQGTLSGCCNVSRSSTSRRSNRMILPPQLSRRVCASASSSHVSSAGIGMTIILRRSI